ncbi:hypothetical protein Acr_15g0007060 [Actinidia rufa]|uniref:CCHC-type domain-containing protein n=1 Tax=Actinidia rufa TaxID=165716 RepID=A0A7J0FUI6_9ERIC|nr:hypothetical protein Acr_15g0007060 [Actinidia rufa]
MDDTQGSGQESENENPQMTELKDMVQMLVGAVTAQQQLLQQYFQSPQPQETRELNMIKANDWILTMEKNFRLLRCGEQQKVEIGSYLLAGEASRWWNLKGVREPGMDWARFKMTIADYEGSFTNLAEYAPHLVAMDEMRAHRFEDGLRHEIRRAIRPLVFSTYADVLDRAIIVEQDVIERKKYFDSKRRQNFRIEVKNEIKCFYCNEVGHIKRNYPRLRTEIVAPRGGPRGGNMRPAENARLGGNRPGNSENRGENVNNQRQGRAFALMPGDARNTEDVDTGMRL